MAFSKIIKDGITIIKVENERLDSVIAPDLKTELLLSVDGGAINILIDLSKVNYADSSGLGSLLFGLRQLKNLNGQFKLLLANEKIMSLIRIARLDGVLFNYTDLNEAIASFKNE